MNEATRGAICAWVEGEQIGRDSCAVSGVLAGDHEGSGCGRGLGQGDYSTHASMEF
ncbi:MAG: hypothetical protein JWM95_2408 [Gemmatimonadetes bacterium]|nr:hypothetical protein [Gemmatimonadota bacterium]